MSSIPLPALESSVPFHPENPADVLMRVMQIKSMMGNQQLQQEQLKSAQLSNRMQSLAADDEMNARHAFHDWDGQDTDTLLAKMQQYGLGRRPSPAWPADSSK